ncbi:MAG TPA: flippase-like domain-containing protein [Clostridia bacterium]|nr:flippase-like domain-containing protein [Clostridia bacterium]
MYRILGIILLALFLLLITPQLEWQALGKAIRQVPFSSLLGLVLLQLVTQLLLNCQWCSLGKTLQSPVSFNKMLYINSQGTLLESITPGAKIGGEVVRVLLLKNIAGYSAAKAVSLVTIQKLFSFSSFFLLSLAALFHITGKISYFDGPALVKGTVYTALVLLITVFMAALLYPDRMLVMLKKRNENSFLVEILTHMTVFRQHRGAWWRQLGLSFLIWLLFPLKFWLLVRVFTHEVDLFTLAGIAMVAYLAAMLPVAPGGLGSFEVTMSGLLLLLGLPAADVVVITVLFRFITFWLVVLLSLLFVAVWKILCKEGNPDGPLQQSCS